MECPLKACALKGVRAKKAFVLEIENETFFIFKHCEQSSWVSDTILNFSP